jgi:hypothetical protein
VSAEPNLYSEPFREATQFEADRLRVEAERLRAEAAAHLAKAEGLSAEALAAEQQARELDELLGRAPQLRLDLEANGLRGQRLRELAVETLARRHGLGHPIHYRDWYQLVTEETGVSVEAKDPLATFLVQVTRSPVVAKVEADPGVYVLDPERAGAQAVDAVQRAKDARRQAEHAYAEARAGGARDGDTASIEARRRLDVTRRKVDQAQREMAEIARAQTELRQIAAR